MKQIVLPVLLLFLASSLFAQENRTVDGTGNNVANPDWGAANSQFIRVAPPNYGDGVSTLGGPGWPNPRYVSNEIFAQTGLLNDPLGLSDYCWVFGQFIDHDITLAADDATPGSYVYIQVPQGDPWFDPWGIGQALIPMRRSTPFPGTGTGPDNPREHQNFITSFIDASAVYGSDQARADWLRTFQDGKLKTSAGNMLPFNTIDGEYDSDVDANAPHMDDPVGMGPKHYVAGDVRANENVLLASFHTLFVREHNRMCDEVIAEHPTWTDEEVYQHVRKLVGGMQQAIVYEEWLPTMGVHLDPYTGYDPSINAGISNVFSAAAYRLGHTLLTDTIRRKDMEGQTVPEGNLLLKDAFFHPMELHDMGVEPYLKGMGAQVQQSMDNKVIDAIRNFLFGPPGSGGLDLASINITRGRERGIPALNDIRIAFGLPPHQTFEDITGETTVSALLENVYGSLDSLDAWVGMLAESHMSNALFGETIMTIMTKQFQDLRDGDRFYYLNDPALSDEEKQLITDTRLEDLVCRNSDIPLMQENVFIATPHEMLCTTDEPFAAIGGGIQNELTEYVSDVTVDITDLGQGLLIGTQTTDQSGLFEVGDIPTCDGYRVTPFKDINVTNGVTTLDLVAVQKHILGLDALDSPYQHIAADANKSNTITTLDLVEIRKVILIVSTEFPNNTSWRFVDANYVFDDPTFPLAENFPEYADVPNLNDTTEVAFVAVKVGDVNNSANPAEGTSVDTRSGFANLMIMDTELPVGEWASVAVYLEEMGSLSGLQFALSYDKSLVEFGELEPISLPGFNAEHFNHLEEAGVLTFSWNNEVMMLESDIPMFSLRFRANQRGLKWSDVLQQEVKLVSGEMYNEDLEVYELELAFDESREMQENFALYQTIPNPAKGQVRIPFFLPEAGSVGLEIYTATGQVLYTDQQDCAAGTRYFEFDSNRLGASGPLFYKVLTADGEASRSMIVIE
ncbi:MAG: hypothetical protein GYB31_07750 [Bacteroidetes bacterium]|nr:hypothetical protein [Bacteroidota bacterium]